MVEHNKYVSTNGEDTHNTDTVLAVNSANEASIFQLVTTHQ